MERITIAVIDDHPLLMEGIVSLMQRKPGFALASAGSQASDICAITVKYKPDAMVVDLNMPGDAFQAIADAARAILDVHIVLSRSLAESGHFPAIDIEQSASRVMHNVVTREHFEVARQFRAVYSRYQKSRDLVQVGAYVSGSDPELDAAIRLQPVMAKFLQQNMFESASLEESCLGMAEILS